MKVVFTEAPALFPSIRFSLWRTLLRSADARARSYRNPRNIIAKTGPNEGRSLAGYEGRLRRPYSVTAKFFPRCGRFGRLNPPRSWKSARLIGFLSWLLAAGFIAGVTVFH
jgi:hypothetical protein